MGIQTDTSTLSALAFVSVIFFLGQSVQACDFPDRMLIPNGKTATEQEMTAAGLAIEKYITAMQDFAECVESETGALRRSAFKEQISGHKRREDLAAKRQNKAAAAIGRAVEKYNQAVEYFNLRAQK